MNNALLSKDQQKTGYTTFNDGNNDRSTIAARSMNDQPLHTSFFSRLLFTRANSLLHVGNARQLSNDDLWDLPKENQAAEAFTKFNAQYVWHDGSVNRALLSTYGGGLFLCGLATFFSAACSVFAPVVLHHVIEALTAPVVDMDDMTLWLAAFFASKLLNVFVATQTSFYLELLALRLTVALKSLLFHKKMRKTTHNGKVVDVSNLFTSDVMNILWATFQINNLWILPLQIAVVVYLLYNVLDVAAFAGLGVMGVSMIISFIVAVFMGRAFGDVIKKKDERLSAIKDILSAIQPIKFNTLETKFGDKLRQHRSLELKAVRRLLLVGALSIFMLWSTPLFVSVVSFGVYSLVLQKVLTAAKVFTAIALFSTIRSPLRDFPTVIQTCFQAKLSIDRISEFLLMDEYNLKNITRKDMSKPENVVVAVEDGSFGWSKGNPILKNVNLEVKRGDLVVVHGASGAGKSSLCAALLGEMEKISGSVFVRGRVAYYSQKPWVQSMTIRDNILLGQKFDSHKYQHVIEACGLLLDLEHLPAGDLTEIGEKGVVLSAEQKARVSLARVCYTDADVFVLDSPFAVVNPVVQSQIFSKCICGYLEKKTIILVTHTVEISTSEAVNYSILVKDGKATGTRLTVSTPRFMYAIDVPHQKNEIIENDEETECLIEDDEQEERRVSKQVFVKYLNSIGGVGVCLLLLLIQTLWQAFQISSDLWLSYWSSYPIKVYDEKETRRNISIYALLSAGCSLAVLARAVTVSMAGLRGSRHLFTAMTTSLLNAPMKFFNAKPIGRIVNRYGDDILSIDFMLPFSFGGFLASLFFTICQLATATYLMSLLGLLVIPIVYIYVRVASFYLTPSREIAKLWKISSTPVLNHVIQLEDCVAVIRAFGSEYVKNQVAINFTLIDINSRAWFAETVAGQWFQVRMQLLGCSLVIVIILSLMYLRAYLSPGLVGLAFTYTLSVESSLGTLVRVWSQVEILMASPERVMEFAAIPGEDSASTVLVIEPSSQWPQQGTIKFENVVFSYNDRVPPALKNLSFSIENCENIGIIGHRGAGKSSLAMALFRMYELISGRILVDGEDISTMPVHTLRSRLSIVPQIPIMFKGSLRVYIDPFDDFSDVDIWTALGKVDMKERVSELDNQLSYEVSESGEVFSMEEQQLLCLARALLRTTRVVFLDETPISMDHAMEKKIRKIIRRDFCNTTVLRIANRLAPVLDFDRIMVMTAGEVAEFDTPANLVKKQRGIFYQLAKKGGYLDQLR